MRTLLIGYDLNKPLQDYAALIEKIKSLGAWWHYLDSTWLLRAILTAEQVRDQLSPHIDRSDELLVIDVTADEFAWIGFPAEAGQWILKNYK